MPNNQHSTFWLGFAFVAVLSMLAGLGLFGMAKLKYINQHLNEIAGELQTKIGLTVAMRRAARERTVNLQHLIILDDPFDKDDAWMLFNHNGALFADARLTLLNMPHSAREQDLLNQQGETTAKNIDIQLEVAELAMENKNKQATELLINVAIPVQNNVFRVLDDLYQYYDVQLAEKKHNAQLAYINTYRISWIVGGIALFLGSLIGYITVSRIINIKTQLIKQQQKLKSSEQQLQMAMDASNDGLWDWDIKHNKIYYSPRWLEMFGYSQDEDTSSLLFWQTNIHKADEENLNKSLQNHLKGLTDTCSYEYRLADRNGNWIWVMDRAKVTEYDEQGKPARMVGTHKDITDRKKIEFELKERQHFFKGVLDDMQTAVVVLDPEGNVLFVNDSPLSEFGFNSDMLGEKFWKCSMWSSYRDEIKKNIEYVKTGHNIFEDIEIRTQSKHTWLALSIHPVFDNKGAIEYIVPECRIITDRIQMENALRRSQKMDAIGQLSGGIAHDFNNQLGIVIGYLDMLPKRIPADDEISRKWVKTASNATQRCMDLTGQLLSLSRHQPNEIKNISISKTILTMKNVFNRSVTPEIQIRYTLPDDLWLCSTDESELQDTVLNMVINARDAMPEGGEILIEASNIKLKHDEIPSIPEITTGEYVKLMISDNGRGMSKDLIEKAFEPFFTTKPTGKGTGLGLSMVYAFVQRYNGYIQIYSEENQGTTIIIYFPRSLSKETEDKKVVDIVSHLPVGQECILIVDDEKDLLDLACQYLQELGYKIYAADTPLKAIELLEQHDDIDMLFSDIVMPGGISGYDLAQKAHELNPDIKILLTSGYASMHQKQFDSKSSVLNKPYRKDTLAHRIRHIFDK